MTSRHYDRGKDLYSKGDFQAAITEFSQAIQLNSGDPSVGLHILYSNRCACRIQLKDNIAALSDAKKSVEHSPAGYSKGYSRLGSCYYNLKMTKEALGAYERALEAEPGNAEAVKMVALLRRGIEDGSSSRPTATTGSPNPSASSFGGSVADILSKIKGTCSRWISEVVSFFYFIHPDQKPYYYLGGAFLAMLLFKIITSYIFSSSNYHDTYDDIDMPPPPSSTYSKSHSRYDSYGSSWSSGYGMYGLSTSALVLVTAGGYFIPPLIPGVLGPERARPFFGMSWMTFMWLVRMLFGGGGGGGFYFGGNRRRRGFF